MNSSIPYLLLFFFTLVFSFDCIGQHGKKTESLRLISVSIVYLLFIGLRGFISTDWGEYYPFYNLCPDFSNISTLRTFNYNYGSWEYGFLLLSSFFKTLRFNYFTWVFFLTFIDIIIYHAFFKKYVTKNVALCYVFFILFSGMNIELNLLRGAKSFVIYLISINYLFRNRKTKIYYYLINILGCFFHISSVIYLLLGPFFLCKINKNILIFICIFFNVLSFLNIDFTSLLVRVIAGLFLPQRFLFLVNKYLGLEQTSFISIGYLERTFSFFYILAYQKKIQKKSPHMIIFCNSLYLYYFCSLLFKNIDALMQRLPTLFCYSYWILYPYTYSLMSKRKKQFFLCILVLYGILKIYFYFSDPLFQYENLLFGITPYNLKIKLLTQ